MIRFFGRPRVIAVSVIVIALMAGIAIFLGSFALIRLSAQTDRVTTLVDNIQSERVRNINASCVRDNHEHASLAAFIAQVGGTRLAADFKHTFPPKDCAAYTRAQTSRSAPSP